MKVVGELFYIYLMHERVLNKIEIPSFAHGSNVILP